MSVFPTVNDSSNELDGREHQLMKLGGYLKTIRTSQGLSLQQVAKCTHIQPKQLSAIEAGNWMQLPEAVYVKGFLKRYAQSLGLDGATLAAKLVVKPASINPKWLNPSDFSSREQWRALGLVGKLVG